MIDKANQETSTEALVKFKNGKSLSGIILGFMGINEVVENLKFIPNQLLKEYQATENPECVVQLDTEAIHTIDVCLK